MNGVFPQYVGPTSQYRQASLYPAFVANFLLEAANDAGGVARPFKRLAVTPEVMAQIQADWAMNYPTVDIATTLAPIPVPKVAGNVVPFQRSVVMALPQLNLLVRARVAKPVVGYGADDLVAKVLTAGNTEPPSATALPTTVESSSLVYRTVTLPDTVRNPSDEELVAIAMAVL